MTPDYKARHTYTLLVFGAVKDAIEQIENGAPLKLSSAKNKNLNMGHGMRYYL